ncbi:hypothetical protein GGX14DRAFT_483277 [Mycena pura]|uniref:LysM domain-containing protein n=1 Tax=Mycena pura TaxID=153505 RepID=A0AAD6Y1Q4_9AGAR|nr:hypothetical protein GGX14DRAFT_483277 [Mycena pura]
MFKKLVVLSTSCLLSVAALPLSSREGDALRHPGPRLTDPHRCTQHYTARTGDTCQSVSIAFGLAPALFVNMNSKLGDNCDAFAAGDRYCVQTVSSVNPGRSLVLNGVQY